jgi:hypothetical protein
MKKLHKLGIALGISLIAINNLKAEAASVSYQTEFSRFLPSTFNPGDTFDLSFRIHDPRRPKPIHIVKIIYHVVTPLLANIFIPLYFETLSSESFSNFTTPPGSTPPDGANLTLAGLDAFAITNSFVPSDFGITRSDIVAANLFLELETDGLIEGDGFVASLNLNGTSIGSEIFEPVPEPSSVLAVLTLGGAMATFKKKSRLLPLKKSKDSAA